jgi:biopolymer transport protein ExbD
MNFRSDKRRSRVEVIVDITPLIDVVFLLLIFFMITTTFATNAPGIEVELPKAAHADSRLQPKDIVIAINEAGEIVYENRAVTLVELSALLESKHVEMPQGTVIVQADQQVFHGLVVKVMDAAKSAGFEKLAIATQKE